MSVLVVGSANQDIVIRCARIPRPGETVVGETLEYFAGGKGANQAVAIGRLGGEVAFCGCVSADSTGENFLKGLEESEVDTKFAKKVEGVPMGTASIYVEPSGENSIVIVAGANQCLTSQMVSDAVSEFKPNLVLCQLEIPIESVIEASKHSRFLLNPSPAQDLSDDLLSQCEFLIPNEHELALLTGMPTDSLESCEIAANRLLKRGVQNVVVTLGPQGAIWCNESGSQRFEAPEVEAVDTTGAGDCFSGAFACFLDQGREIPEAIMLAIKAASISVTRPGAQPSMPNRNELGL